MPAIPWPEDVFDLVFIPHTDERLDALAVVAEPEEWDYRHTTTDHKKPILYNYVRYTYRRLAEENKIAVADDGTAIAFNTGLVTPAQEPLYCYCTQNKLQDRPEPWHFHAWRRQGEYDLTRF